MNAKEYLEYVRSLDIRLRMKDAQISQLQRDICYIRALDYTKDRITGGSPVDISDKIARLDELIREANEEWDELIAERERANARIRKLESIKQQEVLTRRFIYNEKWEVIAVKMDITWQGTWQLFYRALRNFQKIFEGVD
nr:MAG TPA: Protein of unknown function (DUF1492) [Caudoviricetes sp.]